MNEKLTSELLSNCQISNSANLKSILFLGYVPPVNQMKPIGSKPKEQLMFPLELMYCPDSHLVQISCEVSPEILFPPEYPYTSGTTKILRDNFYDLYLKCKKLLNINENSFIIDIGSNDGTLLSNFLDGGCKVLGIDPTDKAQLANKNGINSLQRFFNEKTVDELLNQFPKANIITAANVFAHIRDIHNVMRGIKKFLIDGGVFISENHYLLDLINNLQYDTIYHEHLRYYSLHSLKILFEIHDMEIFHVERIPTHGGSIRVFSARKGQQKISSDVANLFKEEQLANLHEEETYKNFAKAVMKSKVDLYNIIKKIKDNDDLIYGISAPSRASTLISYANLDETIIDCIMEIGGSHKIGKYMPGTLIPVLDEEKLFLDQPEYAFLFSWHIADELISKLKQRGYKGKFIVPLPFPKIVE